MSSWPSSVRHLADLPRPQRPVALREWLRHRSSAEASPDGQKHSAGEYDQAFAALPERVRTYREAVRTEADSAPAEMRRLLALAVSDRAAAIHEDAGFQTWSLSRALGRASLSAVGDNPGEAVHLASLALEVARAIPSLQPALRDDLLTSCFSHLGNAQRAASLFAEAAVSFRTAEECYKGSIRDPARLGFLRAMQADYYADRSEFDRSLTNARRAGGAFREAGDLLSATRASIQEAAALFYLGNSRDAARLLDAALPIAERAHEPRLMFILHGNRAAYLVELEEFAEARRALSRARAILAQIPGKLDRIRLAWIEAELDAALGNLSSAEGRLRAVREIFLTTASSHEYAIVTLELALVLARAGRFSDAKQAAREAIPILQSLGIAPEAILAVRVYADSSVAEAAQIAVLNNLVGKLKRWRPIRGASSG